MNNVNAFLLAYSVIITFSVVFVAIHVIYKDRYYRSKFARNLVHCDNILNQHKITCIETDRIHHNQAKKLSLLLDSLIKTCSEENVKEKYTEYLNNKYEENRKLQENKTIEKHNKEVEEKAEEAININVDDGAGLKKVVDSDYVGDFIEEWCPLCNAQLLGNNIGQKWCSFVKCEYGLTTTTEREKEKQ